MNVILIKDKSRQKEYSDLQEFLFSCDCNWGVGRKRKLPFKENKERIFIVNLPSGNISHSPSNKTMKEYANSFNKNVVGMYNFRTQQKEIAYTIHNYDNSLGVSDDLRIFLPYDRWNELKDLFHYVEEKRRENKWVYASVTEDTIDLIRKIIVHQKYKWEDRMKLNEFYNAFISEIQ